MVRVLGLGNEILSDDAFGILAARRIGEMYPQVDVVCTPESGFHLLDAVLGASRLIVVDTIQTRRAEPGTVYEVRENGLPFEPGGSPHRIGLFETLALARSLELPAPDDVTVVAVEAADCLTVGGPMDPRVEAAMPQVLGAVSAIIEAP